MTEQRHSDAGLGDGRDETENERMDRNWNDILQELRVTQTGTQILTGFLLTIAFQPRFSELSPTQLTVYLILVSAAALTTALGIAPVNLHRALFRQHAKADVVRIGHLILRAMLVGVAITLTGTIWLIFEITLQSPAGPIAGGAMALFIVTLFLLPRLRRRV